MENSAPLGVFTTNPGLGGIGSHTDASHSDIREDSVKDQTALHRLEDPQLSLLERWEAAKSLGNIAGVSRSDIVRRAEWLVLGGMGDTDCWVRLASIKALCEIMRNTDRWLRLEDEGSSRQYVVSILARRLKEDDFLPMRRCVVEALAIQGTGAALAAESLAAAALEDSDRKVRVDATNVLGLIGESAVTALELVFRSDFWPVRSAAAQALGEIVSKSVSSIEGADPGNIDSGKLHENKQFPGNDHPSMEGNCCKMLSKALTDTEEAVRLSAAAALGRCGSWAMQYVPELTVALRDEHISIRIAAATSLGKIGSLIRTESGQSSCIDPSSDRHGDDEGLVQMRNLTCRALAAVLRDRAPQIKANALLVDAENESCPCEQKRETGLRLRKQAAELLEAAEEALGRIGDAARLPLMQHLFSLADGAFMSRMALMRALHSACRHSSADAPARNDRSDERACAFLSEWIAARRDLAWAVQEDVLGSTLPLCGLDVFRCIMRGDAANDELQWAIMTCAEGVVYLAFGVPSPMAFEWSHDISTVFVEIKHPHGLTAAGSVAVHQGFWSVVDAIWEQISNLLREAANDVGGIRKLYIVGSGLGGALAQVVVIRLISNPDSLSPGVMPGRGADGDSSGAGVVLMTFGSPNVACRSNSQDNAALKAAIKAYCMHNSTTYIFNGDPLPAMLSSRTHQVHTSFKSWGSRALRCCSRRSRYSHMYHGLQGARWYMTRPHAFEPLVNMQLLRPIQDRAQSSSAYSFGRFDESLTSQGRYTNAVCVRSLGHVRFVPLHRIT